MRKRVELKDQGGVQEREDAGAYGVERAKRNAGAEAGAGMSKVRERACR